MKISKELRKYLLLPENTNDIPKAKYYKLQIICSSCGFKRQSNAYDVLDKQSTKCNSCKIKEKWCDPSYRDKSLKTRRSKEYRKSMRNSMKKSIAWKKTQSIRNKALKDYWENIRGFKFEDIKDKWYLYRRTVYKMSESSYLKYNKIINPKKLPRGRGKYHLDHKFSIMEGFKNNIPPYVISHYKNLQMLTESENISKDYRCDITKDELFKEVFAH